MELIWEQKLPLGTTIIGMALAMFLLLMSAIFIYFIFQAKIPPLAVLFILVPFLIFYNLKMKSGLAVYREGISVCGYEGNSTKTDLFNWFRIWKLLGKIFLSWDMIDGIELHIHPTFSRKGLRIKDTYSLIVRTKEKKSYIQHLLDSKEFVEAMERIGKYNIVIGIEHKSNR